MKGPRHVVVMPTWVGDSVMALASLRGALEAGEVMLLGQAHILELVSGEFRHLLLQMEKKGIWAGVRLLLKQKSHRGILLPNSMGSAMMGLLGGLCSLTGTPYDGRGWLLSKKVVPQSEHQAFRYREILQAGGVRVDQEPRPWVSLPQKAVNSADELLRQRGLKNTPLLAVHPGASKPQRCWPLGRFVEVCSKMGERGWRMVILGGKAEAGLAAEMARALGETVAINVPEANLSLAEMTALLARCHLFLGNDSGPMHLASAVGVRVVSVFGSTSPRQTGPLLPQGMKREVWSGFECSPCRERFFKDCEPVEGCPPCLHAVSVEQVTEAIGELAPSH